MFFFGDPTGIAIGFGIAIFIFIVAEINKGKERNQAYNSIPVKATVKKLLVGENGTTQVVFEKENGDRVNLEVPNCTLLEGETGMLKYSGTSFASFSKITETKSEPISSKDPILSSNSNTTQGSGWVCSNCGKHHYDYETSCSCGKSRLDA